MLTFDTSIHFTASLLIPVHLSQLCQRIIPEPLPQAFIRSFVHRPDLYS